MIRLQCTKKPEVQFTLLAGKEYEVGRKGTDITLPGDQSVSRKHAKIWLDHPLANISNPCLTPVVVITDEGSKFGTYAKDGIERKINLPLREPMNLDTGDVFKFGLQHNEFKIEYTPFVITTSAVKDIHTLKEAIRNLGGHQVPEWTNDCNYLVMENLTLTIKAACALLSCKLIVTPEYFLQLLKWYQKSDGSARPEPSDFLPTIAEPLIQGLEKDCLNPNQERRKLFKGKTFVFVNTKSMKKVSSAVRIGDGKCKLISDVGTRELKAQDVLVVSPTVDPTMLELELEASDKYVVDAYKNSGKRLIQESEIALAAIYASCEKNCNPNYNLQTAVFPTLASQSQASHQESIIIHQTEKGGSSSASADDISRHVVEETIADPIQKSRGKTSEEDVDMKPERRYPKSKRIILADTDSDDEDEPPSSKRRLSDDEEEGESSSKRARNERNTSSVGAGTTQTQSQSKSIRTLNSLFALSSDEEEDEDNGSKDSEGTSRANISIRQDGIFSSQTSEANENGNNMEIEVVGEKRNRRNGAPEPRDIKVDVSLLAEREKRKQPDDVGDDDEEEKEDKKSKKRRKKDMKKNLSPEDIEKLSKKIEDYNLISKTKVEVYPDNDDPCVPAPFEFISLLKTNPEPTTFNPNNQSNGGINYKVFKKVWHKESQFVDTQSQRSRNGKENKTPKIVFTFRAHDTQHYDEEPVEGYAPQKLGPAIPDGLFIDESAIPIIEKRPRRQDTQNEPSSSAAPNNVGRYLFSHQKQPIPEDDPWNFE